MSLFNKNKTKDTDEKKVVEKDVKGEKKEKKTAVKSVKKVATKDLYKGETMQAVPDDQIDRVKKGNAYKILVKPLITEKAANLGEENKYFFAVEKKANKIEIAEAIYEVYGVKPILVNVINVKGKKVRFGKTPGKRKDWKKAIITLPKGKTIKIYEGV